MILDSLLKRGSLACISAVLKPRVSLRALRSIHYRVDAYVLAVVVLQISWRILSAYERLQHKRQASPRDIPEGCKDSFCVTNYVEIIA